MTQSVEDFTRLIRSRLQDEVRREVEEGHAFFRTWYAGKLTRDQVGAFYQTIYFEAVHAGRLLGRLLSVAPNRDAFNVVAQNMGEELGAGQIENSHPELILRLAGRYGRPIPRVLEEGPVAPLATLWPELGIQYADRSFAAGLASFTYIEAGVPSRHAQQRKALVEHYGAEPALLAFHDQHLSMDAAEAAGGKNITDASVPGYGGDDVHVERQVGHIARFARSADDQNLVLQAISAICDAKIKYYCQCNEMIAEA
ncbi:MAG TPA: iron-containing redox enzyme family protein [Kofleriaceae bacterium]